LRLGLALAISGLTIYLALRQVNLAQVGEVLKQADWRFAMLGVLSGALGVGFKIGRWLLLLRERPDFLAGGNSVFQQWRPVAASFLSAQLINNFYPLRVGEIGRVAVVGRAGAGYAFVAGTIAVEKAFDLAAFGALAGLLLVTLGVGDLLGHAVYWLAALGLVALAGALWAAAQQERLAAWALAWLRWLPGEWDVWLLRQIRQALAGLGALRRPHSLAALTTLTVLIWGLAWWTNQLAAQALGLSLPPGAALLVLMALQIGISLPSLPGRLGVFEYVCILALQSFGIDPEIGLSYGILLHVVVYLPIIVAGLPAVWFWPSAQASQAGEIGMRSSGDR
jgi:uncharacterized membrane protein YbhN (UPF0104 family)